MVNYVISFCKITGASKIFSRNFYLPLLKPATPREAFRTFRITGKWLLGAKIQHYIPVLLNHKKKRSKKSKSYGKLNHKEVDDYIYMTPQLDPENENHKVLLDVLNTKNGKKGVFVYTVKDKMYNIVLKGDLEYAIRDGDVIDLMVSQKNDKVIIKLKNFKKVPLEISYYDKNDDDCQMFCGEGATTPEEEQFHHHGKYTMSLAKIFEDKERLEDEWEEMLKKLIKRKKRQAAENTKEFKAMVKENLKSLDWDKFEEDAKKVIEEISVEGEKPLDMEIDNLEKTKHVNEIISKNEDLLKQLPTMSEIAQVVQCMANGDFQEFEFGQDPDNKRIITGVKIKLFSGKECFVSGQIVYTDDGEVFVPGQTIETEYGSEYTPGLTINVNNKPTLISGLIMAEDKGAPMFVPTQSTITSEGQLTFAMVAEERPPPQTEEQIEVKKLKRIERIRKKQQPEIEPEVEVPVEVQTFVPEEIIVENIEDNKIESESTSSDEDVIDIVLFEDEDSSNDVSSIEMNISEIEELDIEAIRLKQEKHRAEMEKLKLILLDDGLDELIANLELKKIKLQQKLEELRNISIQSEATMISYVTEVDANELVSKITDDSEIGNKLIEIFLTLTRKCANFKNKYDINSDNINAHYIKLKDETNADIMFSKSSKGLKMLLKSAVVAANDLFKNRPKDQLMALGCMGEILIEPLSRDVKYVVELIRLMNTPLGRMEFCDTIFNQLTYDLSNSKLNILMNLTKNKNANFLELIQKLLESDAEVLCAAFTKIVKLDSSIIESVLTNVCMNLDEVNSDDEACLAIEKSIINSVKSWCDTNLIELVLKGDGGSLEDFIHETLCFAKALGMNKIENNLMDLEMDEIRKVKDKHVLEFFKRVLLIQDLAKRDYSLKSAIERLKRDPERARDDPRIRQLIRESGALMFNSCKVNTSKDIPLHLMTSHNLLAIEDYLIQKSKIPLPVLITKGTFQAIIPKEAARGVLAGRVAYALLDESGVMNFKPMHMTNGLNLNENREKRIENYLNVGAGHTTGEAKSYLRSSRNNNGSNDKWGDSRGNRWTMTSNTLSQGRSGPRA